MEYTILTLKKKKKIPIVYLKFALDSVPCFYLAALPRLRPQMGSKEAKMSP
jgi:hypothetical protein